MQALNGSIKLQDLKPALVVIDTLVSFTSGKLDTNRANQVGK